MPRKYTHLPSGFDRPASGRVDHTRIHTAHFLSTFFPSLFRSYFWYFARCAGGVSLCFLVTPQQNYPSLPTCSVFSLARACKYAQKAELSVRKTARAKQNKTHKQSTPRPSPVFHILFLHQRASLFLHQRSTPQNVFSPNLFSISVFHHLLLHSSNDSRNNTITAALYALPVATPLR